MRTLVFTSLWSCLLASFTAFPAHGDCQSNVKVTRFWMDHDENSKALFRASVMTTVATARPGVAAKVFIKLIFKYTVTERQTKGAFDREYVLDLKPSDGAVVLRTLEAKSLACETYDPLCFLDDVSVSEAFCLEH